MIFQLKLNMIKCKIIILANKKLKKLKKNGNI